MSVVDSLRPLLAAIADLGAWLNEAGIPHCLIGGVAAGLLGRPRITRDVDAVSLVPFEQVESLLEAGIRFGIVPRISDAVEFAGRSRVLLLHHKASGIDLDVSLAALPFEEETIARARTLTVQGVKFLLPSPEDLIIMKAVASRPQDWVDIEAVLDAHAKLDFRRVRKWLKQFAEALDSPDMTERFEAVVARRRNARAKRKSK